MKLKVVSWNIWLDGFFQRVTNFLERSGADIIGLQEVVSDEPKRNIIGFLNRLGYQRAFGPVEHSWGGNVYRDGPAIFSRYKILKSETFVLSKKNPRAAVRADISVENKILHVFSTHLIHTHQQESKEQDEQVENLVKLVPQRESILMGDFNALPDSKAVKKVSEVLVNTDPELFPTWSVYREGCEVCGPDKVMYKLDYIFTSKDIKTQNYKVESSKASDHLPISALIEL